MDIKMCDKCGKAIVDEVFAIEIYKGVEVEPFIKEKDVCRTCVDKIMSVGKIKEERRNKVKSNAE